MSHDRSKSDSSRDTIRRAYASIASKGGSCCGPSSSCCGPSSSATRFGYAEGDLAALPRNADMGLSCGNPFAVQSLKPGEIVLDLGSGGGFDVFIAGRAVGPEGRVIGVDMTPEMIATARAGCTEYQRLTGWENVEFRLGEIEHLPVADRSVDVVMSNCVINLSPDKPQVWREAARVLRPGGRIAVSDIVLVKPLPDGVRASIEALVGCIAGAVTMDATERMLADAGFTDIEFLTHPENIAAMTGWNDPLYRGIAAQLPAGARMTDYITEATITAVKQAD